jgi:hypothetical protein
MTHPEVKTARELRKLFFDNDAFYAVLIDEELTNSEVRRSLYDLSDQDTKFNSAIDNNCVLIWNVKS